MDSHALSLKRIADALEVIKDKSFTVNVTVQPANVVIQTIDLTEFKQGLIDAISGLTIGDVTINPQITVGGGGCSGDCGGTCGDLMCVIAPAAAAIVQQAKAVIKLAENDIQPWPDSTVDSDPPMSYTPYPDTPQLAPPSGYTQPPGGMNGSYDPISYAGYRCDISWYIVDYLIAYYEAWLEVVTEASNVLDMLDILDDAVRMGAAVEGRMAASVVYEAVAGETLVKTTVKTSSRASSLAITALLEAFGFLFNVLETVLQEHITYLGTRRKMMACALLKAKDFSGAIKGLNDAAGKLWAPTVDLGQGYSAWKPINTAILGNMPQNLFACMAGYDFSEITGYADTYGEGCLDCNFTCDGATTIIDFNIGQQGWFVLNPPELPEVGYGEVFGLGMNDDPDPERSLGVKAFRRGKTVRIESTKVFKFTQVCVKYGGQSAGNNSVNVYVGGVLAMSKTANIDNTVDYEIVTLNIEEDKVETFPNEQLVNGKFQGTVSVERFITGGNAAGGQGRIFGVAF